MDLGLAFRCFYKAVVDPQFAARAREILTSASLPKPDKQAPVEVPKHSELPKPSAEPLQLLALLQRDGRLLDFLFEDISAYPDEQVGAGVREIHRDCKQALDKYLEIGPVIDKPEDQPVEVPAGFDPAAIRLTGSVKGKPPYRGRLAHRGWRVVKLKLPESPAGIDALLIAPAEVEIS